MAQSSEGSQLCRVCWEAGNEEPGGRIALHCHCTTGVHDSCLLRWLLAHNSRQNLDACELCKGRWHGDISVSLSELAQHVAAYKQSANSPGGLDESTAAEIVAHLELMRERNKLLAESLAAAEEAEAKRQQEFQAMKRIAMRDRQVVMEQVREAKERRRSNLRWVPAAAIVLTGAFLAGAAWHHSHAAASAARVQQTAVAAAAAAVKAALAGS